MSYIGSKPANKPVVASDLDPTVITGQTALAVAPADTDEFLISDAGVLKRLDASLIGGANTPAFHASLSADANISNASDTKIQFNTELYDTDNCYDNSTNYRFTPTTSGKYLVYGSMTTTESNSTDLKSVALMFHKNGSKVQDFGTDFRDSKIRTAEINGTTVLDMNGSSDYVELFAFSSTSTTSPTIIGGTNQQCFFGAYKLIT